MNIVRLIAITALVIASSACTATEPAPAPAPPAIPVSPVAPVPAPTPPPPAPAQPAEKATPTEEATTAESDPYHCNDPEWWNAQQSGDPGTYETLCGEYPPWLEEPTTDPLESLCSDPTWRANNGDQGDQQCGADWDGSNSSTEPVPEEYQKYQEETGYPYNYQEYDQLPGYQQCGSACGQEKTSGEEQHEWGCQQGYIT